MVDHYSGPCAAGATRRPLLAVLLTCRAASEPSVGDVESFAAIASRHEQFGIVPVLDREALEGMFRVCVERPDGGVAGHQLPILVLRQTREDARITAEQQGPNRDTLEDTFVVDADVHIHEDPAGMAEYAPSPWDVALREIAKVPERYLDLPAMSPRAEYRVPWPGGSNRKQTVDSAAEMRTGLDDLHVDRAVLFPDHLLTLAMVRDPRFAVALAQSYNSWLRDHWLLTEPTLKGSLVVAPQDPVASAEDIRRHGGEPEFVCVYLPASGVRPLYGHHIYDPVYDAATEVGLPVVMHSVEAVFPTFPFQLEVFQTSLAQHAVAHPFSMMANMISLLETGVPVRWPDMGIGIIEAGISWIPFMLNRLDKEYTERRREVPFLQERPSHYIRRWYFGTQPIEEPERRKDIVKLFELFEGGERAMFASDWPHHDFDHPQYVFGLPFSPSDRRAIMGGNATRFFRLES